MGLLTEMKVPLRTALAQKEVPAPKRTFAEYYDPAPEPKVVQAFVPTIVREEPVLEPEPPQVRDNRELTVNRDKTGLVDNVTGYNAAGEEVTFAFDRDGTRSLQKIKVR